MTPDKKVAAIKSAVPVVTLSLQEIETGADLLVTEMQEISGEHKAVHQRMVELDAKIVALQDGVEKIREILTNLNAML